jgi:AraC-like DNA-binding protein
MSWTAARWDIPLLAPPSIIQMSGHAGHGTTGIERYRLRDFWCLNLYEGTGQLEIAGQTFPIRPGYASITVPDEDMEYRYEGEAVLVWTHFRPAKGAGTVPIPVMQDLGRDFPKIRAELVDVTGVLHAQPHRAVAKVWDVLWRLTERADAGHAAVSHVALRRALAQIDQRLGESISVEGMAEELSISQTHLNRLFRAAVGTTVTGYIRRRRVARAHHLLLHSTLPVQAIGMQVGFPDPHHFNKVIRRELGRAPRRIRGH